MNGRVAADPAAGVVVDGRVAADPAALESYAEAAARTHEPLAAAMERYRAALAAFASAGSNHLGGPELADLSPHLAAELAFLRRVDAVPAEFAAQLRALDGTWTLDRIHAHPGWIGFATSVGAHNLPGALRTLTVDVYHAGKLRHLHQMTSDWRMAVQHDVVRFGPSSPQARRAWQRQVARWEAQGLAPHRRHRMAFDERGRPRGYDEMRRLVGEQRRVEARAARAGNPRTALGRVSSRTLGRLGGPLAVVSMPGDARTLVAGSGHAGWRDVAERTASAAGLVAGAGAVLGVAGMLTPAGWVVVGAVGVGAAAWSVGTAVYDHREAVAGWVTDRAGDARRGLETVGEALGSARDTIAGGLGRLGGALGLGSG